MKVFIVLVICCSLVKTTCAQSCTTPNGEKARCISIKDCKIFLGALKDGILPTSSVVNFMRESTCGFDNGPLVCCGNFNHHIEFTPPTADPRKHKNLHLLPTYCGLQEVDDRGPVATEAQLEEFPWMALIQFNSTDTRSQISFLCGGTLINSQYILTAAHCTFSPDAGEPFSVRLGEHDLKSEIDCRQKIVGNQKYGFCINGYEDITIDRIIRHFAYSRREKLNDIALIRLARPATISTNIRPICLPLNGEESPPGKRMFIAGWGNTETYSLNYEFSSNVKLKAQLPIVAWEKCKELYSNTYFKNITKQHLCAGGEKNVNACKGDTGHALVTPNVGSIWSQWYMEGILSFGIGCEHSVIPNVFTKVSNHLNWILDHIE